MKKYHYLMGMVLLGLATSCSEVMDEPGLNPNGDEITLRFEAPEALQITRAVPGTNSGQGGLVNVDWNQYDLRYQVAVYSEDGSTLLAEPQLKTVDTYGPVTFNFRLTPNNTYKFVAWADFVRQGETADLHYNTADFTRIAIQDGPGAQLNDESRDAYFLAKNVAVSQTFGETMTLKRPFAKLRVVTTDWASSGAKMPDNFKVSYHDCTRFVELNAVTGEASGGADADASVVYTATLQQDASGDKFYEGGYDATANNRTLFVDYLIANDVQQAIHFSVDWLRGTESILTKDFTTNIPIQRNYLTTILGNLLTVGGSMTINIEEGFVNEWIDGAEWWQSSPVTPVQPALEETRNASGQAVRVYRISTRDEFAWLPDHITEMVTETYTDTDGAEKQRATVTTILLENDIDMNGVDWKPIYTTGENTYTVDGQGHVLRNFSMNGQFGAVYEYKLGPFVLGTYHAYTGVWGKFEGVMKNLTFENITINGLANSEVDVDTDGNPVDHSKEYAYFAGCIGYTGANYSTTVNIENVQARHVRIKASDGLQTQNVGGLVGWIGIGGGNTWLKNCSVDDVTITGYQAGGLVGQVVGGRGVAFTNCSAENVIMRMRGFASSDISGFIGRFNDGAGSKIEHCTYPTNVQYIDDATGLVDESYEPASPYYGYCGYGKTTPTIVE